MTIKNALNYFQKIESTSIKKSEIKVFQEFIRILRNLEDKDLSITETNGIETELDTLDLKYIAAHNKRHYKKALKQFEKYLMDNLSLNTKGYYTKIGIALGMSFGLLFGIVFLSQLERSLGIALGISIGMFIGLFKGSNLDAKVVAEGNMI